MDMPPKLQGLLDACGIARSLISARLDPTGPALDGMWKLNDFVEMK
jgi:hypothetical protein